MNRFQQPSTLLELSLDSFGKCIFHLGTLMIFPKAPISLLEKQRRQKEINAVCKYLKHIQDATPPALADAITAAGLESLQRLLMLCSSHREESDLCLEELASTYSLIVHPATTTMDIHKCDDLARYILLISKPVNLTYLKISMINIEATIAANTICSMKNLEYLIITCSGSDIVISAVVNCCPRLKCLVLEDSSSVTDNSCQLILQLQLLQQLGLTRTNVTSTGLSGLLEGLKHSGAALKITDFKTSNLNQLQLNLLISDFPNLEYLATDASLCDSSVIQNMKNLHTLGLYRCNTAHLSKLLTSDTGKRLKHLELRQIQFVDFRAINHCCLLKSVIIERCTFQLSYVEGGTILRPFSLRSLTVECTKERDIEQVLPYCHKTLTELVMILYDIINMDDLIMHICQVWPLTLLEKLSLHIGIASVVHAPCIKRYETLECLFTTSPDLTLVQFVSDHAIFEPQWQHMLKKAFPGLNIKL